jgi:hypothetical protein
MSKILIDQPAGLGDIIFCQKLADYLIGLGHEVVWPISSEYLEAVKKHIPKEGILYCEEGLDHRDVDGLLSLKFADRKFPNDSVLKAKYLLLDMPYEGWQDSVNLIRDTDREDDLYYNELGLKDGEEYTLLNLNYGTYPDFSKKNIPTPDTEKIVHMDFLEGYTLFDWCKIIENSKVFVSVDTAINYIVEKINTDSTRLELYSRFDTTNWKDIDGLFMKQWNLNK